MEDNPEDKYNLCDDEDCQDKIVIDLSSNVVKDVEVSLR